MAPVDITSVVDIVTVRLRQYIVADDLPAGLGFTVTNLASQLGVSHVPVREALRRLEMEGLVAFLPTKGGEVRAMNRDDVLGLYRLRLLLEPKLAAESVPSLTRDDLEHLEAGLEGLRGDMTVNDRLDVHRQFHLHLLQKAMSEWDYRVWNYLYTATERYARLRFALDEDPDTDRGDHMPILDAVISGSESRVQTTTAEHLEHNRRHILGIIERFPWTLRSGRHLELVSTM